MDWSGNLRHFVSRPADQCSNGFLYNYNYDQYQGMEMKHQGMFSEAVQQGLVSGMEMKNSNNSIAMSSSSYGCNNQDKKKRLTSDQLDSLERSFQEEIKLDPDRKMKLSRDLGLQPRQIAVWFQNRRARWKAKQLERLYDTLKQEFDVISKEKQTLQDEVMKLKAMLKDQISWKQVSTGGYTEISGGEETVESTSDAIRSSSIKSQGTNHHHHQMAAADQCNNIFNMEEYNTVSAPPNYWGPLPSYP